MRKITIITFVLMIVAFCAAPEILAQRETGGIGRSFWGIGRRNFAGRQITTRHGSLSPPKRVGQNNTPSSKPANFIVANVDVDLLIVESEQIVNGDVLQITVRNKGAKKSAEAWLEIYVWNSKKPGTPPTSEEKIKHMAASAGYGPWVSGNSNQSSGKSASKGTVSGDKQNSLLPTSDASFIGAQTIAPLAPNAASVFQFKLRPEDKGANWTDTLFELMEGKKPTEYAWIECIISPPPPIIK